LTPPATKITGRLAENPTAAGCSRESALNRAGAAGERRVRHVLDLAELGEHLQVGPDRCTELHAVRLRGDIAERGLCHALDIAFFDGPARWRGGRPRLRVGDAAQHDRAAHQHQQ